MFCVIKYYSGDTNVFIGVKTFLLLHYLVSILRNTNFAKVNACASVIRDSRF